MLLKVIAVLVAIFFTNGLHAQTNNKTEGLAQSIRVGDQLPDVQNMAVNYNGKTMRISEFNGKLVVLDFWATWCTNCIEEFPKENALQKKFEGKLQFILVNCKDTRDTKEKVEVFYAKYKTRFPQFSLPSIILDTTLKNAFPHTILPHYAWIDATGKVIGVTSSREVNEVNIKQVLEGQTTALKVRVIPKPRTPLLDNFTFTTLPNKLYSSVFNGYIEDSGSGNVSFDRPGIVGSGFRNYSIMALYQAVFKFSHFNKVVLEVRDTSKYISDKTHEWDVKNRFYYELSTPADVTREQRQKLMAQDMNRYLNSIGRIEKRNTKCYELVKIANADNLFKEYKNKKTVLPEGQVLHQDMSLSDIVETLNFNGNQEVLAPIIIDATGIAEKVSIVLPATGINDISALKKAFLSYGLDLKATKRELDVFVITEDDYLKNK